MDLEFLTFICGCYFGVSLCIPVLIIACKHKKRRRLRKTGRSAESLIPVDGGKSMLLRPSRRGGANSVRTKPSPTTTPTAEKETTKKDTPANTPEKKATESKEKDKDKTNTQEKEKEKTTQTKTTPEAKNSKDTDKKEKKKMSDSKLDKTQKSSNGVPSINIQPTQASIDNTQSPTEQESMD
uniref:Uncharacterized protein n=1 Tax=Panagrellus redivivus TaxID=6233 RepID=A0A7E4USI1_PANRE